jgi:hypothetical protein
VNTQVFRLFRIFRIFGGGGVPAGGFVPSDVPQADADSLIQLYNLGDGANWSNKEGWLTDPVVANWDGIIVVGGRVTQILLSDNALTGDLSSWVLPTALVRLDFFGSDCSGDITNWTLPSTLTYLRMFGNMFTGDISEWSIPAGMEYFNFGGGNSLEGDLTEWDVPPACEYLALGGSDCSGDISGWTIPATQEDIFLSNNAFEGDLSSWSLPASLGRLDLEGNSIDAGPPLTGATSLYQLKLAGNGLSQAAVDAVAESIYDNRASFTAGAPSATLGGSNAAPSGTYQDGDPPTTGKEYIYEVENDPETEGFNTWSISYTA